MREERQNRDVIVGEVEPVDVETVPVEKQIHDFKSMHRQVSDFCVANPESPSSMQLSTLCVDLIKVSLGTLNGFEEDFQNGLVPESALEGFAVIHAGTHLLSKVEDIVTEAFDAHYKNVDEVPNPDVSIKTLAQLQNTIIRLEKLRRRRPNFDISEDLIKPAGHEKEDKAAKAAAGEYHDFAISEDSQTETTSEPEMVDEIIVIDGEEAHIHVPVCNEACQIGRNATKYAGLLNMRTFAVHQACGAGFYTTKCLNSTQNALTDLLEFNNFYNRHNPESPDWETSSVHWLAEGLLVKIEKTVHMAQMEWAKGDHPTDIDRMLIRIKDDLWRLRSTKHWSGQDVPLPSIEPAVEEVFPVVVDETPEPVQVKIEDIVPGLRPKRSTSSFLWVVGGLLAVLLVMVAIFQRIKEHIIAGEKASQDYELEHGMTGGLRENDELLADAAVWDRPWSELKLS